VNEFQNRVAIVTGTTGIGRAIALRLALADCSVAACGIDPKANSDLHQEAAAKSLPLHVELCDVSIPDQVQSLVAGTVARYGGLDFIVNCAAIHPFGTAIDTDPETWNQCMAVNVGGAYLLAHFGIPELRKRSGGSILNIASVQGYACQRGVAAYATTKGALHSLTRALALDHAADRIRVNSISPGSIRTPMLARSAAHLGSDMPVEEVLQRFGAAHPLQRIGAPEEVAELAVFLLSDKAAFCTGGDYLIDGGLLAALGVQ
jgi:meso-butanediol dehydrogenase / (S,S)-butanediol dehydrogenase / diacetyl reductase